MERRRLSEGTRLRTRRGILVVARDQAVEGPIEAFTEKHRRIRIWPREIFEILAETTTTEEKGKDPRTMPAKKSRTKNTDTPTTKTRTTRSSRSSRPTGTKAKKTQKTKTKTTTKKTSQKTPPPRMSIRRAILAALAQTDGKASYESLLRIAQRCKPDTKFDKWHFYFYRKLYREMRDAGEI